MQNLKSMSALLSLLLLAGLSLLGWQLFKQMPTWSYQPQLNLAATPNKTVSIGYVELGQHANANAADHQHLQLRYDTQPDTPVSGWQLANISATKSLLYKYKDESADSPHHRLRHWVLAQGDTLQIDQTTLIVTALDNSHISLSNASAGQTLQWQHSWWGDHLSANDKENANICQDKLQGFYLGGSVQCNTRWRLLNAEKEPALSSKAAKIAFNGSEFSFIPLATQSAFRVTRGNESVDLLKMEIPLLSEQRTVREIIVGKTPYVVSIDPDDQHLTLTPSHNIPLFSANDTASQRLKAAHLWQPSSSDYWVGWTWLSLLLVMLLFSLLVALTAAVSQQEQREPPRFWQNLLVITLPLIGLYVILIANQQLAIASLVLVAITAFLSVWLGHQQKLSGATTTLWLGFIGLAGMGLLVQMQLAVGADNSSWYRYPRLQAISLAIILWGVALLAVFPKTAFAKRWQVAIIQRNHFRPWLIIVPIGLVLLGLMWLKLSGSEAGVSGFQPAEFAKLVLVILIAIALSAWFDLQHNFWQTQRNLHQYQAHHWWQSPRLWIGLRLGVWVSLVLLLTTLVLGSVRDFSPILILLLLLFGYLWAIRPKLPKAWQRVILILPLIFAAVLGSIWHYPETFATLFANYQGERLLVWVYPWLDPDMGLQAQRSLSAIHQAGWLETQWFGANGELMSIPAVQNDFILAFVLAHTGALGGLLLLALQLSWLGLLFALSETLRHVPKQSSEQWLSIQFLAWVLYGLAWLQLTHWLISWCNVLGLLPIMGQPMTWLSSGNSHLLALGLPTVLLALIATWLLPSNPTHHAAS